MHHIRTLRNRHWSALTAAVLMAVAHCALQAKDNLWTPLRVGDAGSFGPEIGFASDMERLMPDASIAIVPMNHPQRFVRLKMTGP